MLSIEQAKNGWIIRYTDTTGMEVSECFENNISGVVAFYALSNALTRIGKIMTDDNPEIDINCYVFKMD